MVCRQLGYPDAVAALSSAHYGQGSGPIWFDSVQCHGNELDFFECTHSGISYRCNHDNDASVECSGTRIYTHHLFERKHPIDLATYISVFYIPNLCNM